MPSKPRTASPAKKPASSKNAAKSTGAAATKNERIFIQIASYRDSECLPTILDAYAKATHPERIFVGVCDQSDPEADKLLDPADTPYPKNVRIKHYHPSESRGGVWARAEAQSLCKGEEYTLGTDSHMRFEPGWDKTLIAMLHQCPGKKTALSTNLPGYRLPNALQDCTGKISFTHVARLGTAQEAQVIHFQGGLRDINTYKAPFPTPFWIGNFIFTRSATFKEVPHDPNIFFQGEEIAFSARLFTHGYDIYQPHRIVLYHQWVGRDQVTPRNYRNHNENIKSAAPERVRHLLGIKQSANPKALVEIEKYGLGSARSMEEFWAFCGVDFTTKTIEEKALRGRWEAYKPGTTPSAPPLRGGGPSADERSKSTERRGGSGKPARIFVQIASYRDAECQWTIKDMFEKAARPEHIFAGICWQYDPDEDAHCFKVEPPRPDQVRISPWHWKESQGVCWARHEAQKLYEGEEYVLMIDSHMRFVPGWDEKMIAELLACDSAKPVISCHPAAYTPPDKLAPNPRPTILRAHPFNKQGEFRCKGEFLDRKPEKPLPSAFLAAGYIFSKGELIREVPYDPYMYFTQEEIGLAARIYTHGWDIFSSPSVLLYHYYVKSGEKQQLHWSDNKNWREFNRTAQARLDHLLGHKISTDPQATKELDVYGLGSIRTLKQYESWSGLDFKKKEAHEQGFRCQFIPELWRYKNKPIHIPELDKTVSPWPPEIETLRQTLPIATTTHHPTLQNLYSPFGSFIDAGSIRLREDVPEGILILENYLKKDLCDILARYADAETFTRLKVLDNENTTKDKVVTKESAGRVTDHVNIDGMAAQVLTIMNDVYCNRLSPFYNADFEWYERPQILRYPPGGKYNRHADSEHWVKEKNEWVRSQDRDYSVLLYLNEEYEGGTLYFPRQDFRFKPKTGMLAAFPSDHRYLHEAEPTTSGIRYVIVSWAGAIGGARCRERPPYASVFIRQKRA